MQVSENNAEISKFTRKHITVIEKLSWNELILCLWIYTANSFLKSVLQKALISLVKEFVTSTIWKWASEFNFFKILTSLLFVLTKKLCMAVFFLWLCAFLYTFFVHMVVFFIFRDRYLTIIFETRLIILLRT